MRERPDARDSRPDARDEYLKGDFKRAAVEVASLEPSRRVAPERLPHEKTEVEGARVHEQALENVPVPTQVSAAEAAGVIDVGERPLDVLAAAAQKPFATTSQSR